MHPFMKFLRGTTFLFAIATVPTVAPAANAAARGFFGSVNAGARVEAVADNRGRVGLLGSRIHGESGVEVHAAWHRGYGNWRDGAWVGTGWQWYGAYGSLGGSPEGPGFYCNPSSSYYDPDYCNSN